MECSNDCTSCNCVDKQQQQVTPKPSVNLQPSTQESKEWQHNQLDKWLRRFNE